MYLEGKLSLSTIFQGENYQLQGAPHLKASRQPLCTTNGRLPCALARLVFPQAAGPLKTIERGHNDNEPKPSMLNSRGWSQGGTNKLSCQPFHRAIRDRFPNGTRTTPSAVLSSSERFIWTYTELSKEVRPPWWGADLCQMIVATGQLSGLQWVRHRNYGIKARCDWDSDTCRAAARGGHWVDYNMILRLRLGFIFNTNRSNMK